MLSHSIILIRRVEASNLSSKDKTELISLILESKISLAENARTEDIVSTEVVRDVDYPKLIWRAITLMGVAEKIINIFKDTDP